MKQKYLAFILIICCACQDQGPSPSTASATTPEPTSSVEFYNTNQESFTIFKKSELDIGFSRETTIRFNETKEIIGFRLEQKYIVRVSLDGLSEANFSHEWNIEPTKETIKISF